MSRASKQDTLVLTCDQQLYRIAVDISFHHPDLLTNMIVILGVMHFLMNFIASISKLMELAGIKKLICSTFGSVDKMLQGKKFPQNLPVAHRRITAFPV